MNNYYFCSIMYAFGGFQGQMFKTFLQYTLGKCILFVSNTVKHALTDIFCRQTPLVIGHFIVVPATDKNYIIDLNLP